MVSPEQLTPVARALPRATRADPWCCIQLSSAMSEVDASYAHCRRIARIRARNFYYAFTLLPRRESDAMCAIYAFMRHADDIADDDTLPLDARRKQLQDWRDNLVAALEGYPGNEELFPAFQNTVRRYDIPPKYFHDLIDGMESDLAAPRYESFEDLYRYCYQAASVVGLTTIHIFGFDSDDALLLAEKFGIAFQLTNILRDIREDASLGRVYLPESELAGYGLSGSELLDGAVRPDDDRFLQFMEFQWNRADRYYREAAPLLALVPSRSRPALWALVTIYHELLGRIRQVGYNVLDQRVRLAVWKKLWIVARAMTLRTVGGTPSFPG